MKAVFRRLSDRQYGIRRIRDGVCDVGDDVAIRIAPGDTRVPHDLVHFIVEEQAGLKLGIFGQCAAGSDVGGFFRSSRGKRGNTPQARRSRRLGGAGRSDVSRSEKLAGLARDGSTTPKWTGRRSRQHCVMPSISGSAKFLTSGDRSLSAVILSCSGPRT